MSDAQLRISSACCGTSAAASSRCSRSSLLVLIGMIGMGIDYTRGSFANAKMQAALDATALALSSNAATITSSALTSEANTLFSSIYTGSRLTTPTITATYSNTGGPQIVLTGTATLPTTFLNLPPFRLASINLSASSTIAWGQSRLRVALVLDNTGSMADSGKIGALQTATKNLLNQLQVRRRQHRRRLRLDHSLREGRQRRIELFGCELDRLDGLGSQQRNLQPGQRRRPRAAAPTTVTPGRRHRTAPGTAASPIAAIRTRRARQNYDENVNPPAAGEHRQPVPGRAIRAAARCK